MPIGAPELIVILVIALLILGPGKLPEVGTALGKSIREFRKASSDLTESVKVDTSPLPITQAAPSAPPAEPTPPAAPADTTSPGASGASAEPTNQAN
jgi:TatA/E family protein of Tat protein translocase